MRVDLDLLNQDLCDLHRWLPKHRDFGGAGGRRSGRASRRVMKAESSFVGEGKDVIANGEKMIRKKCCRRPALIGEHEMGRVVQKLYDTCTKVFKGPGTVPPPRDVRRLQRILGYLTKFSLRMMVGQRNLSIIASDLGFWSLHSS